MMYRRHHIGFFIKVSSLYEISSLLTKSTKEANLAMHHNLKFAKYLRVCRATAIYALFSILHTHVNTYMCTLINHNHNPPFKFDDDIVQQKQGYSILYYPQSIRN